jgi:hypothetical protein
METTEQDQPPVFRRWSTWYWIIFLAMVVQVIIYTLISYSFL